MSATEHHLPNSWSLATIGDVCTLRIDQGGPSSASAFTYIDISSIDSSAKSIAEARVLASSNAPSRARQRVVAGDVLVSMTRPNLNAVALVGAEHDGAIASTGFCVLRSREVEPKWLFYGVQSATFVEAMVSVVQGALYPAVRPKDVLNYQLRIPPLLEQRRIVAALEEHLSELDAAVASLERARANLRRFRESALQESFSSGNWPEAPIASLVASGPDNGVYLPKSAYGEGVAILRIDDFQSFWSRSRSELRRVRAEPKIRERYALRSGDLVINRVNSVSHLGKCLAVEARHVPAVFESNMMRMHLVETADPRFVALYLSSIDGRRRLTKNAKWAVNQASINQTDVLETMVPVPALAIQQEAVGRIEEILASDRKLVGDLDTELARATRLRQSILKHAFEGKLAPQDPNDEPASVLLDRIRAERKLADQPTPRTKRKAAASPRRSHKR